MLYHHTLRCAVEVHTVEPFPDPVEEDNLFSAVTQTVSGQRQMFFLALLDHRIEIGEDRVHLL